MREIFLLFVAFIVIGISFAISNELPENKFFNSSQPAIGMRAGVTEKVGTGMCSSDATCTVSGYEGACVSISSGCCNSGVVTSGLCPGSSKLP